MESPSDFPAHSELQKVMGFSKTYGIVMGFLKNQSLFWGQSSFQIVMGFLAKPLSQMDLATKNVMGFLKKPVAI